MVNYCSNSLTWTEKKKIWFGAIYLNTKFSDVYTLVWFIKQCYKHVSPQNFNVRKSFLQWTNYTYYQTDISGNLWKGQQSLKVKYFKSLKLIYKSSYSRQPFSRLLLGNMEISNEVENMNSLFIHDAIKSALKSTNSLSGEYVFM